MSPQRDCRLWRQRHCSRRSRRSTTRGLPSRWWNRTRRRHWKSHIARRSLSTAATTAMVPPPRSPRIRRFAGYSWARHRPSNHDWRGRMIRITRRGLLQASAALALPAVGRAQGTPMQLGVLTPLTGAGSFDGPRMLKAMQAVANEINAAGGLAGRKHELVVEDDENNPEA